jgi:hypothetical protein
VPVLPPRAGQARFAGLIADGTLFRAGPNLLEIFLVARGGAAAQRLRL